MSELRKNIASYIASDYIAELERRARNAEDKANQRIARMANNSDPFEPILKLFHGVFTEQYERPEDKLAEPSKIQFWMWAYGLYHDPNFKYLIDWIVNTHLNATFHAKLGTNEQIVQNHMYARAQISISLLLKRELGRCARHYEDLLAKQKEGDFTNTNTVE